MSVYTNICSQMFVAASLQCSTEKTLKCPFIRALVNKLQYIHTRDNTQQQKEIIY